jgi:hypothetical protein
MLRHLFTLLAALSLMLSMATCVLWRRSLRTFDQLLWTSSDPVTRTIMQRSVWTLPGELDFFSNSHIPPHPPRPQWHFQKLSPDGSPSAKYWAAQSTFIGYDLKHHLAGLRWGHRRGNWRLSDGVVFAVQHDAYAVRFWMLLAATSLAPAILTVKRLAMKRRARGGLCPTCGYDLRASPDRCPECGTETRKPANPAGAR